MFDLIAIWFTRLAPRTQPVRIYLYEDAHGRRWTRHHDETARFADPGDAFCAFDDALATAPRTAWQNACGDYLITFRPRDHPADLLVCDCWQPCTSLPLAWPVAVPQPVEIERTG